MERVVLGCADCLVGVRQRLVVARLGSGPCNSEISDPGNTICDENVLRLDIAMDDSVLVRVGESLCYLLCD